MPSRKLRRRPTPSLSEQLIFTAIGTEWRIDTRRALEPAAVDAIASRAEEFDRVWSRFREDSAVSRISRHPGRHTLPPEAVKLFGLYEKLYAATGGALTPLVGRALEEWGYDANYSLKPQPSVAPVPRWEDALEWDGTAVTTSGSVVLDVGAAGKGYLVDLIATVLAAHGLTEFTIDASGDILHRALPETVEHRLRVALEHPLDPALAVGVATISDRALCASASNRRSWPGAHHIIDAITGRPAHAVIAGWAVAESCLEADGLATALFFVSGAALQERFDFEFVRMFANGRIEISADFPGEVFG